MHWDQFSQQQQKFDTLFKPTVVNAQCNIDSENYPDAEKNCKCNVDNFS